MTKKCDFPGCDKDGENYGTYYIKDSRKIWGTFCHKHEQEVIEERKVALQEALWA